MRRVAIALLLLAGPLAAAEPFEQVVTGNGKDGFNLVIAPDGWSAADIAATADSADGKVKAWKPTAQKAIDGLFSIEPYGHYRHCFNIIRLDVASASHGLPMPEAPSQFTDEAQAKWDAMTEEEQKKFKEDRKPSYFGLSWPAKGAPVPSKQSFEKLTAALDGKPCDLVIFIMPDEEINNGKAQSEASPAWVTMNTLDVADKGDFKGTIAHELGHAFFKLGDEYGGDSCAGSRTFRANTTNDSDPKNLKWRHITSDMQPGAHGCDNFFHPRVECRMNSTWPYADSFCAVCLEAMTHRISERYRIIESTDPSFPVLPKYTALNPMHFKVKMRGTDKSDYAMMWTYDGKMLGSGNVTKGSSGPTSEITIARPPLAYGVHIVRFMVEDIKNLVIKDAAGTNSKAPQTKTWVLTVAPSNPIIPIPGVDWTW